MLKVGLIGTSETVVSNENTAITMGSGDLKVFATPCMIALIEKSANDCVRSCLEIGQGTVGTLVNVTHVAATPLNMKVKAESELVEVDRKRLVFKVKASDERGIIGEGVHERFIIDNEKFMGKVNSK